MAIIANQTDAFGDILYISTDFPAIGLTALVGFVDDTENETPSTLYEKKFQYSLNGLTWSEWVLLTIPNIQAVPVTPSDSLYIKLRYQQSGDGILAFNSATITGTYQTKPCPFYFTQSIFHKYFSCTDIEVLKWYINVSEKLYTTELSSYVNFDDGFGDPTDAIVLWQSVGKFFAFYVILARTYKNFYQNLNILDSYLTQRGLFTSNNNTLIELNKLMQNFNNEIFKRGTLNILKTKAENNNLYQGELRRLLNLTGEEDFIFDIYLPQHCGWWIDESSPLYRGLEGHVNANKLENDNLSLTSGVVTTEDINGDINYYINAPDATEKGIIPNETKFININKKQNYILDFEIEVLDSDTLLNIGFEGYDINLTVIPNCFKSYKDNLNNKFFIQSLSLERFAISGGFFPVKCILFNVNKPAPFINDKLNILTGNNLKFNSNDVLKIYPHLTIQNGSVNIKNLMLRPLTTEYERAFIHMNHFVSMWIDEQITF